MSFSCSHCRVSRRRDARQPFGATGIDLDGRQWAAEPLQHTCKRAVACTDFDDRSVGVRDGLHNDVDDGTVVKKVLAVLVLA